MSDRYAIMYDSKKDEDETYSVIKRTDHYGDEYSLYLSNLDKEKAKDIAAGLSE